MTSGIKQATEDSDGVLTDFGMQLSHQYAVAYLGGDRMHELESGYPELAGVFYDIRNDRALAEEHALSMDLVRSMAQFTIPNDL